MALVWFKILNLSGPKKDLLKPVSGPDSLSLKGLPCHYCKALIALSNRQITQAFFYFLKVKLCHFNGICLAVFVFILKFTC